MRIVAATTAEVQLLKVRWRAITRVLGPTITLEAVAPDGRVIDHQPPEPTASMVPQLIAEIQAHLLCAPPSPVDSTSDLAQQQPQPH